MTIITQEDMKKLRKYNIFGWMAAAAMLLNTSCTDDTFEGINGEDGDIVTVTLTVTPETA